MVSEKKIFKGFFNYKSVEANDPRAITVGRIYVGDHITLLHTKSVSSGPHGFREKDF